MSALSVVPTDVPHADARGASRLDQPSQPRAGCRTGWYAELSCGISLFIVFGTAFPQPQINLPCGYQEKACAAKAARTHPAVKIETWEKAFHVPLEDRVGAPSQQ